MAFEDDDKLRRRLMDENAYWRGEYLRPEKYPAVERCTGCFGCLDCSPAGDTAVQGCERIITRFTFLEVD